MQFRYHLDPTKLKCKNSLNQKSQDHCREQGLTPMNKG